LATETTETVQTLAARTVRVLENVPTLVREKRLRDGLSPEEAADEIGVSVRTLYRIQAGTKVAMAIVIKALCWLGDTELSPHVYQKRS
jgi:ribosome-binding protein aMBF1 (putative translation factor)